MSRVLKAIAIPSGVTVSVSGQNIDVKGTKGTLSHVVHDAVEVKQDGDNIWTHEVINIPKHIFIFFISEFLFCEKPRD